MLVCKGNEIDAPEANKFLFRQFTKAICKGVENRIAGCLNTMSDYNLPLLQQVVWQEVHEDSKKGAFTRALCSRNEVNTVIQEIRKRGGFDSRSFEECILFGNRISQVNPLKQCR